MRPFLKTVLLAVLSLGLITCASTRQPQQDAIPLPDTSLLPCCWQIQEKLQLMFADHQTLHLNAVLVLDGEKLTVILLNQLGNRWLTVVQEGTAIGRVEGEMLAQEFPVENFLLGVHVRHLPGSYWHSGEHPWTLQEDAHSRVLSSEGDVWLTVSEIDDRRVQITYPAQGISVTVTELSRKEF